MSWAVVVNETGVHIMPVVTLDGDTVVSASHRSSPDCECGPVWDEREKAWNHYDPEHPGGMTDKEFYRKPSGE